MTLWDHPWTPNVLRPGHCGAEFIDPPCDVFKFIDTWHKLSDQWNCKNHGCLVVWGVYHTYLMHIFFIHVSTFWEIKIT